MEKADMVKGALATDLEDTGVLMVERVPVEALEGMVKEDQVLALEDISEVALGEGLQVEVLEKEVSVEDQVAVQVEVLVQVVMGIVKEGMEEAVPPKGMVLKVR